MPKKHGNASVKVFCFLPRRPDLNEEAFHTHWRHPHGTMAKRIESVRRYVQAHAVSPQPAGNSGHDGVAELWFDDAATANSLNGDPNYADFCGKDEWNFLDLGPRAFRVLARPRVIFGAPPPEGGVKLMLLINVRTGVNNAAVAEALAGTEQIAALKAVGALAAVANPALPESYTEELPSPSPLHHWLSLAPYDLVYEIWWPDHSELDNAVAELAFPGLFQTAGIDGEITAILVAREEVVVA